MRSDQDGRFYVMEFNPRVWLQYRIGEGIGLNLPSLALAWFSGHRAEVSCQESISSEWIDLEEDFFVDVLRHGKAQTLFRAWRWCTEQKCPRIVQGCKRPTFGAPWKVMVKHLLLRPSKNRIDKLLKLFARHATDDVQSVAATPPQF